MKALHILTWILIIVGALNWGLVGAFDFNLVMKLLGTGMAAKVVYILVGLSAAWEIFTHWSHCKHCASEPAAMAAKPMM